MVTALNIRAYPHGAAAGLPQMIECSERRYTEFSEHRYTEFSEHRYTEFSEHRYAEFSAQKPASGVSFSTLSSAIDMFVDPKSYVAFLLPRHSFALSQQGALCVTAKFATVPLELLRLAMLSCHLS